MVGHPLSETRQRTKLHSRLISYRIRNVCTPTANLNNLARKSTNELNLDPLNVFFLFSEIYIQSGIFTVAPSWAPMQNRQPSTVKFGKVTPCSNLAVDVTTYQFNILQNYRLLEYQNNTRLQINQIPWRRTTHSCFKQWLRNLGSF